MTYPPQQPPWPPERPAAPPGQQPPPWPRQDYPPPVPPRYPPPPPPSGYGRPAGQAPPPPRRPGRRGWIIAGSIVGTLLVIGAIGNALGKPKPAPSPAAVAAATTSAAVPTPTTAPAAQSCKQTVVAWRNNTMGFTYFTEVTRDESRLTKAAQAGEPIAVKQDGADMAAAAQFARAHPIPECADAGGYYRRAMTDWERSGNLASAGNFASAAKWISRGGRAFQQATIELNEVVQLGG
jgi:hypothetical protein